MRNRSIRGGALAVAVLAACLGAGVSAAGPALPGNRQAASHAPPNLTGHWSGTVTGKHTHATITLTITQLGASGSYSGDVVLDTQEVVTVSGDFDQIGRTLEGGGIASGSGMSIPFTFKGKTNWKGMHLKWKVVLETGEKVTIRAEPS